MDDLQECRRANQALRSRVKQLEKGYDLERTAHNRSLTRADKTEALLREARGLLRGIHGSQCQRFDPQYEWCDKINAFLSRVKALLEKPDD